MLAGNFASMHCASSATRLSLPVSPHFVLTATPLNGYIDIFFSQMRFTKHGVTPFSKFQAAFHSCRTANPSLLTRFPSRGMCDGGGGTGSRYRGLVPDAVT